MWKPMAAALLAVMLLIPAQDAAALETDDLLALVAMPLAVAAVSEMTNVPMNDLIDVVTLMNDAAVPPAQFVEVVRYAPAAIVYENEGPSFATWMRTQSALSGLALVDAIERQMPVYGLRDVDFDRPATRVIDVVGNRDVFFPQIVRERVRDHATHPHGGPPGQIKKQIGVQTGAEVVHGSKPGRGNRDDRIDDDRMGMNAKGNAGRAQNRGNSGKGNSGKGNSSKGNGGKGKGGNR